MAKAKRLNYVCEEKLKVVVGASKPIYIFSWLLKSAAFLVCCHALHLLRACASFSLLTAAGPAGRGRRMRNTKPAAS